MPDRYKQYYGQQFDKRRTQQAHGDARVLLENHVNLTMPAGLTHFDHLMAIGRSCDKPFPIKYLSEKLKALQFSMGKTYFGNPVDLIQQILLNYSYLRWWMEESGLVVSEVSSELGPLSDFDRVAGSLFLEHSKNGTLSLQSLAWIADKLDAEGFQLKQHLQPAQLQPITKYNQKYSREPIRTFSAAVRRPHLVRSVRRRLYVARARYKKALRSAQPIFG
jgi:hypothetical protein